MNDFYYPVIGKEIHLATVKVSLIVVTFSYSITQLWEKQNLINVIWQTCAFRVVKMKEDWIKINMLQKLTFRTLS